MVQQTNMPQAQLLYIFDTSEKACMNPIDVDEFDDRFQVYCETAGYELDEIEIAFSDPFTMHIIGEKQPEEDKRPRRVLSERKTRFQRTLRFQTKITDESMVLEMHQGVLHILVFKNGAGISR
ncbi:hypothetical protein EDD86DRAFT_245538 [Gorgonomyces haynaldii]|nr:hypothetical protein EDD86DRAFT_245538 [Gorgonomyces haynaldii]